MHYHTVGQLATWVHDALDPPLARILLVHGMTEHSGRHLNTVHHLTHSGVEVVRFDLRGSGQSGGRRQWIEKFQDYVSDTAQVLYWSERELKPLPLFLLGHSLGGAIAVFFAAAHQDHLSGLVLSAPAYQVGTEVSPMKIFLAKNLARILPKLSIPTGELEGLSRDNKIQREYHEDPLCCHRNTTQQGMEILNALPKMPSLARKIKIPTLIVHGSLDKVVRPEGSFEILEALNSPDRTLFIIPGGYHEPHNDLDKQYYFQTLSQWIQRQLGDRP